MNIVALVGNLATDPEIRTTSNDRSLCTFRLAVSRSNGTEADFFTIVTWERTAEVCNKYLAIGRRVAVEGRLHHTTWTAEDGTKRSRVEVIAQRVHMIGPAKKPAEQGAATSEEHAADTAVTASAPETADTSTDFASV